MRRRRGFSLLEVLMAVALFGAVVTTILSVQAGLVEGNREATDVSQALEIGRCRMSEIEEKQLRLGFPEIEEKDSSNRCCNEKEVPGFTCEWKVERVTLPQATSLGGEGGLNSVLGGGLGLDAGLPNVGAIATGMATSLPGPMGSVMVNPMGGAQLDLDAGMQSIGQTLQQSFGGAGTAGLLSLVFSLVYPQLKPLLEASIRRVTVDVKWKEGGRDRSFTLTQYITNPSQVSLLAALMDSGAPFLDGGGVAPITGGSTTGTGAGTTNFGGGPTLPTTPRPP